MSESKARVPFDRLQSPRTNIAHRVRYRHSPLLYRMPEMTMRSPRANLAPPSARSAVITSRECRRQHRTSLAIVHHQDTASRAKSTHAADPNSKRPGISRGIRTFAHHPEPQKGIEPLTARLRIECSTTELLWQMPTPIEETHNALTRTRTATPCGTTPSRWRVYQFHHQGKPRSPVPLAILQPAERGRRGSNPRPPQ